MIDGYIKWLQTALGNDYLVVNEEKTDYNTDKNVVILSEFSGTNYRNCITFGYQASVLTNNIEKTMSELQEFTWLHNDERISTPEFPYIKNIMAQPINVSNFQQYDIHYIGSITIAITLIASINLLEIDSVTINGEPVEATNITPSYQATTDSNRVNYQELNSTDINEASLTIQMSLPVNNCDFMQKIRDIMFGKTNKNEEFSLTIGFSDGVTMTDKFKVFSAAISHERTALTAMNVTFIK